MRLDPVDSLVAHRKRFGGSSSGRTTVSDTVYLGSNPSPPAKQGPTVGPFLTEARVDMSGERNTGGRLAPMALAALGVVFGDIGTSPLYAMSACFTGPGIAVTPEHVLGVLSLIFWSLVLVILLKYVTVVLNADNKGEGGVLALTALVINTARASPRRKLYGTLGILGASLFFADGAITPAISVLSAVEGLHVAAPDAQIPILPITVLVLVGLFLIQRHGTGSVGKVFGPVMLGWFAILAVMGVSWIVREPKVLFAL